MTYAVFGPGAIGAQPIAETSATQKHPVGTRVKATDPIYREGEFIYLLGVASTVVGSIVSYDKDFATSLCPVGNNVSRNVAVAMSANVASQWGWYQIAGLAVVSKTSGISIAAGAAVGVKTIGKIATTGSGKELLGATAGTFASAGSTATVVIDRPKQQGRVT